MKYTVIDPVILDLGVVQVHWYGVMYLLAFISVYLLASVRLKTNTGWTRKQIEDLIFYGALGAVLGGRLGYLIFYNLSSFASNPLTFFDFQGGGMSFHGGFIGVLVAALIFNRKSQKTFFETMDFVAPLVPLGLAFGRIGNYINAELWGKVTTSVFGVYGPDQSGEWAVRYPSQLYEGFLEGIVLFIVLWVYTKKPRPLMTTSAIFLTLYGFFRFIIEFVRVPDAQLGYLAFGWLTMGQLLSLPMIIIGAYLFYKANNTNKTA
ncbi:MAG TPA: prolipoprotein diacylglyceryl transferase [Candidatus Thioglobus sp.]|jgi:phosphatidylglycerol:prolipoprotein diacylglycerol transferase|nr:prolipoprotein diacylglyceryl transferase [Candidatus Thioglobus sp.]HIL20725.1 prolipoprotein diacylglyceryl transferase [Candidatus Thioglobus sp.]